MAVKVTDEIYTGPGWSERERFVSGDHNSASVHDDVVFVTVGGNPELKLSYERVKDLRDVLDAAVGLFD